MVTLTPAQFSDRIEHTILKPEATAAEVHRVVTEAIEHDFAAVCIAPVYVARVKQMLRAAGSRVACCTVVGFPQGTSKSTVKAIEATSAIKEGADEIDVVAHLPYLMDANADAARYELMEIVRAARAARPDVVIKVIVESALLCSETAEEGERRIAAACMAVRTSGCDFIKTSTGFHPAGGAGVEAVRLMKKHGEGLRIKAAGGIRDVKTALAMIEAGADRLGTSASLTLVSELAKISDVSGES